MCCNDDPEFRIALHSIAIVDGVEIFSIGGVCFHAGNHIRILRRDNKPMVFPALSNQRHVGGTVVEGLALPVQLTRQFPADVNDGDAVAEQPNPGSRAASGTKRKTLFPSS